MSVHELTERRREYSFLGRTRYYRHATCPWAARDTALPNRGDTMPAAWGDGTTDELAAICIDKHPKQDPYSAAALVDFTFEVLQPGITVPLSLPASWTVAPGYRQIHARDDYGTRHAVGLEVPNATSEKNVLSAVPLGRTYPGSGGIFAARHNHFTLTAGWRPGKALLVLQFLPPTLEDVLVHNPGYVLVEARSENFEERPFVDMNGRYVWHQERDPGGAYSYKWEPISGSGIRLDRRMQFRTRFAKPYGMGGELLKYHNTVNSFRDRQYWNCPTGTLRFAAWAKTRAPTTRKLWSYDCLLEYNPEGWNKETQVQKYVYKAYAIELLQADGTSFATKQYKELGDWHPSGAPYPAEFYKAKQWPLLLGKYDW